MVDTRDDPFFREQIEWQGHLLLVLMVIQGQGYGITVVVEKAIRASHAQMPINKEPVSYRLVSVCHRHLNRRPQ